MKLAAVLERVRMANVEYELSFHRTIGDDACRHTLAEALPQEVTAIGESLKGIIWRASHTEAQKRIETVKNVLNDELNWSPGVLNAPREIARSINGGSATSFGVYSGTSVKQYFGVGNSLPYQTHEPLPCFASESMARLRHR